MALFRVSVALVLLNNAANALWTDRSSVIHDNRIACRGGSAVFDSNGDGIFEIFYAGVKILPLIEFPWHPSLLCRPS